MVGPGRFGQRDRARQRPALSRRDARGQRGDVLVSHGAAFPSQFRPRVSVIYQGCATETGQAMRARILAGVAAALLSGAASAETFEAVYDVYLGGLRGGEVTLRLDRDAARYHAEARMRSAGLARLFFPGEARAQAQGAADGAALTPEWFTADNAFGESRQTVALRYGEGVSIEADPPYRVRPYDADLAAMGDALDPVSAAVASLAPQPEAAACDRTVTVFDTRRRFDLTLGPAVREGDLLRCEGVYRRVAGFKAKQMKKADYPFTAWWRVEGGRATLERAIAPTGFGHAVAKRRM